MAAYSLDFRKCVLRAWDSGMDAESVARQWTHARLTSYFAWCSGGARPARSSRGGRPSSAPACSPRTRRS